jgi:hypothetical protein
MFQAERSLMVELRIPCGPARTYPLPPPQPDDLGQVRDDTGLYYPGMIVHVKEGPYPYLFAQITRLYYGQRVPKQVRADVRLVDLEAPLYYQEFGRIWSNLGIGQLHHLGRLQVARYLAQFETCPEPAA